MDESLSHAHKIVIDEAQGIDEVTEFQENKAFPVSFMLHMDDETAFEMDELAIHFDLKRDATLREIIHRAYNGGLSS